MGHNGGRGCEVELITLSSSSISDSFFSSATFSFFSASDRLAALPGGGAWKPAKVDTQSKNLSETQDPS